MTAALDNGVTAAVDFTIGIVDENDYLSQAPAFFDGENGTWGLNTNFVLSLTTETAGLYFGDTEYAAKTRWKSAGDMEADAFSEADGEQVLRGDLTYGGIKASVSNLVGVYNTGVNDLTADSDAVQQLSIGVAGDVGAFNFAAAYQSEATDDPFNFNDLNGDFRNAEIFGLSGGTTVAGATVTVAYAKQEAFTATASPFGDTVEKQSIGVQVAYPFGPVTATVYFVAEEEDGSSVDDNYGLTVAYVDGPISLTGKVRNEQGRDEWNIDGAYDLGNGLTLQAGLLNENEGDDFDYYVAGVYDLGSGAELLVAFAEDKDADQGDEIGAPEYMPGTTVQVSFKF